MYVVIEHPSGEVIFSDRRIGKALKAIVDKLRVDSDRVEFPPRDLDNTWSLRCGVRTVLNTTRQGVLAPNYITLTGQEKLHLHRLGLPVGFLVSSDLVEA